MSEITDEIARLKSVTGNQAQLVDDVITEVTSHRGRIAGLEARNTQIEHDVEVLTTTVVQTTAQVDTHTAQIAEHDTWFLATFERLGADINWVLIWTISIILGAISVPLWYVFVFEQYGLSRHFADANNQLVVDIPADPARMWLISAALGVFVAFGLAFILSFWPSRADETNDANEATAADTEPAPVPEAPTTTATAVPVAELPPPPAPAPTPAAAGAS